ncbi:hypothetical protein E2C01_075058 [Portunus trituberculatus]|uniref:Uncharacterized protein n=1 Tax=Portunus trituberculatus TaxID=210409 RepID=A0A5B7II47_PORTR|nr:hypothetical protein [Portunus trituberculatus]
MRQELRHQLTTAARTRRMIVTTPSPDDSDAIALSQNCRHLRPPRLMSNGLIPRVPPPAATPTGASTLNHEQSIYEIYYSTPRGHHRTTATLRPI